MLPFTPAQFLDVFARYNTTVWPAQVGLVVLALAAVWLATLGSAGASRVVAAILALFWGWMGAVYHIAFFRSINPGAVVFGVIFLLQAAVFLIVGVFGSSLRFRFARTAAGVAGALLIVFALVIYRTLGFALGHHYPAMPTFGLPCPTTILTLGLLLWTERRPSWLVLIVPLAWSVLGVSAALQLGMYEDIGLFVSGVLTATLTALRPRSHRATVPERV